MLLLESLQYLEGHNCSYGRIARPACQWQAAVRLAD